MDHNASFFHFAITSWMYGRRELSVYGPRGTESLLDALVEVYSDDLEYRREFGRPTEGITDIDFSPVTESFRETIANMTVTACPVDHSIETYAYKIEAGSETVVYSADTGDPSPLVEFAANADILIQNCGLGPEGEDGTSADRESWRQYLETNPAPEESPVTEQHCTPEQAARVGADADVDRLVLTHFPPMRDFNAICERVAGVFDGDLHIAKPGKAWEV
jgi:ribonuclease BN (tRNA processing enzyme)